MKAKSPVDIIAEMPDDELAAFFRRFVREFGHRLPADFDADDPSAEHWELIESLICEAYLGEVLDDAVAEGRFHTTFELDFHNRLRPVYHKTQTAKDAE